MPAIVAIVGASNSGKTSLIEKLLPLFLARGLRCGTLKHDAHRFEVDHPGKDSYRHREAGAEVAVICGDGKLVVQRRLAGTPPPEVIVAACMADLDLVLVEGFKRMAIPKLEVVRAANSQRPLCNPAELAGLVTDLPLRFPGVPTYGLDDVGAIAARITTLTALARPQAAS
jgi:molybdopterin-guanine dinucleotide biosynthesis protein B